MEEEELEVEGAAGEPVELPLSTGPATGFAWQLDLPPGVARVEDGPGCQLDPAVRLGGAEGGALRLTAPRGEHVVHARLARPWAPDQAIRSVTIRLRVR